jgi:hypothetical protein
MGDGRDELLKDGADAELSDARLRRHGITAVMMLWGLCQCCRFGPTPNADQAAWLFIHNAECRLLTGAEPAQYAGFSFFVFGGK